VRRGRGRSFVAARRALGRTGLVATTTGIAPGRGQHLPAHQRLVGGIVLHPEPGVARSSLAGQSPEGASVRIGAREGCFTCGQNFMRAFWPGVVLKLATVGGRS
jgi:hypothetical protein